MHSQSANHRRHAPYRPSFGLRMFPISYNILSRIECLEYRIQTAAIYLVTPYIAGRGSGNVLADFKG